MHKALLGNGAASPAPGASAPASSLWDILKEKISNPELGAADMAAQRRRHSSVKPLRIDTDPATGKQVKVFPDGTTESE